MYKAYGFMTIKLCLNLDFALLSMSDTYSIEACCLLSSKCLTIGIHFRSLKSSNVYLPLFFVIYTSLISNYKTYFLWLHGVWKK